MNMMQTRDISTQARDLDVPQQVMTQARRGNGLGFVLLLAIALIISIIVIAYLQRSLAEPLVLGFLALLAIVGVFSLLAGAFGLLRLADNDGGASFAQLLAKSNPDGSIIVDGRGGVLYSNEAYCALTRASSSGATRSLERLLATEPYAADALYQLNKAVREQRMAFEEIRLLKPIGATTDTGEPHWYRIRVRPLHTDRRSGIRKAKLTEWTISDINYEKARHEDAFQELRLAIDYLDHAPVGFFSADTEGRIIYLNATLADWLGYDLAQFQPGDLGAGDIIRGDSAALLHFDATDAKLGRTRFVDVDLVTSDNRYLPTRLLYCKKENTGDIRTIVISRSPGQDAEEELRATEVRFSRFFNNMPVAITSITKSGRIRRPNATFLKLFGDSFVDTAANAAKEIDGESVRMLIDVVDETGQQELTTAIADAALGKVDIPAVEAKIAGKSERSARFFVSAIKDADVDTDEEVAIVCALDTTEQRALEERFTQGQKMQAIGKLAGGVAHDFNNVLTAIIGFSDLLLASHKPSDPSFKDIMNIKNNANRAAGLVGQLLAFSRRQTLRPQVLYLSNVLSDLSILLDRLLGEKVNLEVVHGRDLWPVEVDINQLEQVIINLAVNARDAMPDGGALHIRTRNVEASDAAAMHYKGMPAADYVMCEVEDSGIGMSEEVIDKIFEPFFTTKSVGNGTGLGLSTVYGIIKQTGGYIYTESVLGEGTTFRIFLPRHVASQAQADDAEPVQAKATPVADLTGQGTILLVEDEEAVRAFAARALRSRGFEVHEAATGVEALEVMKDKGDSVDIVVSDVVMPEMDGPTLLRALRKTYPDMKVVFMSGYAEDAFRKNLDENETFGFLPKPFSLKQLAAMVKTQLEG